MGMIITSFSFFKNNKDFRNINYQSSSCLSMFLEMTIVLVMMMFIMSYSLGISVMPQCGNWFPILVGPI